MQRPKIGVGVFVIKGKKVLMSIRKDTELGKGTYSPPGGHMNVFETIEECAHREVLEEAGITIKNLEMLGPINTIFEGQKQHYVVFFMRAEYESGQVQALESTTCDQWEWIDINKIPENLFLPVKLFFEQGNTII